MKLLRKLLENMLGFKGYLRLVSKTYIIMVGAGLMQKKYPELFFLKKIIRPGFTCIDIGANLGYYSTFLSKLAGPKGTVLAVEPIPLFQQIWTDNVKASGVDNLKLLPYALGSENTTIQMGTPERNGLLHHGMTKVVSSNAQEKYAHFYDVAMKVPDELFSGLQRLDFVKCDVEGFEFQVFSNMQQTLARHLPLIQTELNGDHNRDSVIALLEKLGYQTCVLSAENELKPARGAEIANHHGDFYFKPVKHA
ncbi:FkbM family methyltransferase [Adhaeribacter sp. BT258]|uniref:FkbM family methyltransferase n=1 Tax=Adhaeribacter terrigena TaxID=2793070 RepID=A0ABS1C4P6_9BACT|nr:FkbM family methyltransferase [Adhaeribacter terrigena]MBK0404364.1 FkbM family methyltransferase [Adhaeribacter terrigena]